MKHASMLLAAFLLLSFLSFNITAQTSFKEKIIFASNRDSSLYPNPSLYVMDVDGLNVTQLVDSLVGYMPRISKDGKRIAYVGKYSEKSVGPPQIHVINIDGTDDHVISLCEDEGIVPCFYDHIYPAWSPDGKKIAYTAGSHWTRSTILISYADTNDGLLREEPLPNVKGEYLLDWSPSGEYLLFKAEIENYPVGGMFRVKTDGTNLQQFVMDSIYVGSARYSSSGDSIAYIGWKRGERNIYIMNTKNLVTEKIPVSITGYYEHTISWSHDGKRLVFDSEHQIYILNIVDRTVTQLTFDNYGNQTPEFFLATVTDVPDEHSQNLLPTFKLYQNYPNPFNPSTTIEYVIPNVKMTRRVVPTILKVYDILGREIATLVNEYRLPGKYSVQFNAETRRGESLPSGIYFYILRVGESSSLRSSEFQETRKMLLVK